MGPTFQQPQLEANGNISPRRFISPTAATNNRADQSSGTSVPIFGISYDKTRFPPNSPSDDTFNAIAGEALSYHGPGEIANLDLGGNVTDLTVALTSDASGKGIAASAGNWVGAYPLKLGSTGDTIPVWIIPPAKI